MFGSPTAGSILDTHDIRNYKPIKTTWEVERRWGKGWRRLGVWTSIGDVQAVRHLRSLCKGCKTFRVRAAATLGVDSGKWRRIHFR